MGTGTERFTGRKAAVHRCPVGAVDGTGQPGFRGWSSTVHTAGTIVVKTGCARYHGLDGAFRFDLTGDTADGDLLAAVGTAPRRTPR